MAIRLTDTLGNVYFNYFVEAQETSTLACQGYNPTGTLFTPGWFYIPWQTRCVDLSPYLGKTIVVEVITAECTLSAHRGYGYFDATLGTCPDSGPFNYVTIDGNPTSFNNNFIYLNNVACQTSSINITAPSWPSTYIWSGPPGSGVTGLTTQSISATKGGYYTLSMSSSSSCPITKTIRIADFTAPTLSTSSIPTVCLGKLAGVTVSGANSYTWSTGFQGPSAAIMPTVTTTYTVIGMNLAGCKDTISFTVPVIPPPPVAISGPTLLCQGTTATLTASGASTYTWNPYSNSAAITVTLSVNSIYSLIGKDAFGCTNSSSIAITVNNPSISISHSSATICIGSSITFTSGGADTYTWSTGSNSPSITVAPTTNTVYFLSATNICGVYSKTINVTVNPVPTVNISPPTSTLLCQGITYTISASGASNYTWTGPGISSFNQYSNPCSITNNSYGISTYTLKGLSGGCTSTTSISFSVNPSPTITLVSPIGTTGCAGVTNTVYVTGGINYTFAPSTGPSTITTNPYFVWTPIIGNNSCNIYGDNALGCTYKLSYYLWGSSITQTMTATANTNTVCAGGSATLNANGSANSYTWSNATVGYSTVVSPTATTVYTLTAHSTCGFLTNTVNVNYIGVNGPTVSINTLSNNVCPNTPYTMTLSGANTYTWSDGYTNPIKTITTPITATTYSALGQDLNGCISIAIFSLNVLSSPTISFVSPPDTVCINTPTILTASGALTYSWSTGSTSYTTAFTPVTSPYSYPSVTGYDVNGCAATKYTTIVASSILPIITSTVYPTCPFAPSVITASVLGANSFTWSTGAVSNSISVSPGVTTTYTVSNNYYPSHGCIRSSVATVSVYPDPILSVVPSAIVACAGTNPVPIQINLSAASSTMVGTYISGNSFYPLFPGTYQSYLIARDSTSGCYYSSPVNTINVIAGASVSLSAPQYTTCIGSPLLLSGTPSGGTFSGLSLSSNTFLPTSSGQYCLFYTYTDGNGCTNYDQKCFNAYTCTNILNSVLDQSISILPNPTQDQLQLQNSSNETLNLLIIDISGKVVMTFSNLNKETSTIDISLLSAGIYYVEVSGINIQPQRLKLIKL